MDTRQTRAAAIDGTRLWRSLMDLAQIGATPRGGVNRLALTDLDRRARDQVCAWCVEAGCTISIDEMGNIFARRPGIDDGLAPVMTGSHIDTQPTGGRFDGAYGVMAGLEVMRALNDRRCTTLRPLELVVWTNEEGSRFAPAMIGSGVYAGVFDLAYGLSRVDSDGASLGAELRRIGYDGGATVGGRPPAAFFEVHIEQGPILEAAGQTIGIVRGVQGIRWIEVGVAGQEAHAGPTPMGRRRDALVGAAEMVGAVRRAGLGNPPESRATVGMFTVSPNSRNVVPGAVQFTIDLRHPDATVLARMGADLRAECARIAADGALDLTWKEIWYMPPVTFDEECVAAVERAARALGYGAQHITSGAGHDAVHLARVAPTAMIFVPCKDGVSHNEIEDAAPGDLAAGCAVLLEAMLERANAAPMPAAAPGVGPVAASAAAPAALESS